MGEASCVIFCFWSARMHTINQQFINIMRFHDNFIVGRERRERGHVTQSQHIAKTEEREKKGRKSRKEAITYLGINTPLLQSTSNSPKGCEPRIYCKGSARDLLTQRR